MIQSMEHYKGLIETAKIPLTPVITLEPYELQFFITTIESQKEEIEKLKDVLISLLPNVRGLEITITSEIERLSNARMQEGESNEKNHEAVVNT